jgi:riboflavin transporter FmnP
MFSLIYDFIKAHLTLVVGLVLLGLIAGIVIYLIVNDIRHEGFYSHNTNKRIALIGVLAAVSSALMLLGFPIVPVAGFSFLKIEFSVLFIFLVYIWFDFKSAIIVSLITNLVDSIVKPGLIPFMDQGINFVATMVFLIPLVLAFRKFVVTKKEYDVLPVGKVMLFSGISILVTSVVMVLINLLVVIPVYDSLWGGGVSKIIYAVSSHYYMVVITIFGLFNIVHWGLIALAIVLFGNRLMRVKQYI